MKKIVYLGLLVLFLPAMVFAQEKIETPIWNVGDKWVFDREGPMEVTGRDPRYYAVQFSGGIFPKGTSGIALFERSSLNVRYILEGDQRKEYRGFRKRILNFPLTLGKKWEDLYQKDEVRPSGGGMTQYEYRETFRALGWEEVEVGAGKFRAIKMEYNVKTSWRIGWGWTSRGESQNWYWYSPEVKNFVKCRYEKGYTEALDERGFRADWELVSYELKK